MCIRKLQDLQTVIQAAYQSPNKPVSSDISIGNVTGGVNIEYFTKLKEYQILGISIITSSGKVEFTKQEKMKIIKGFSVQSEMYDALSDIITKYMK